MATRIKSKTILFQDEQIRIQKRIVEVDVEGNNFELTTDTEIIYLIYKCFTTVIFNIKIWTIYKQMSSTIVKGCTEVDRVNYILKYIRNGSN